MYLLLCSIKKGKPNNLATSVIASISLVNCDKQEMLLCIPWMGRLLYDMYGLPHT